MPGKLTFMDSLLGYFYELEQENKPEISRPLATVDELEVLEFLEEIKGKSFNRYTKTILIEFLRKREIELSAI